MLIERIWTGNAGRNFNYVVACAATGKAIVIDPCDGPQCLAAAARRGWHISQVLNTHEHNDHTSGNAAVIAATGAELLAHAKAAPQIGRVSRTVGSGDTVTVGTTVSFMVLDTPGHTLAHICLFAEASIEPVLLCGDTLFNAGVGNCRRGGDVVRLYETFATVLATLPGATRVYPGHEYLARNLAFALSREPGNATARRLYEQVESNNDPARMPVTTLELERQINPFLRLESPEILDGLRRAVPEFPSHPGSRDVFLALRALRDRW